MSSPDPHLRLADADDADEILAVCGSALGWSDRAFDRELFRWKHFDNAFAPSTILVAEDTTGILAVRPFMSWQFATSSGDATDTPIRAARAVDTATRPDAQGRGLFRRLTERGLDILHEQDASFVFNTPNDKSRPGYLKMGWELAGRVGFGFAVRSPLRLATIARSRTAAHKPSIDTPDLGIDVADGLSSVHDDTLGTLLDAGLEANRLRTAHTLDSLRWRFARGPISYRWLPTGPDEGCVVRLRQRGRSRELLVALVLTRSADTAWHAVTDAMGQVGADYCLTPAGLGSTLVIERLGPTLTLRSVTSTPSVDRFAWSPGDIELF